MFNEIIKRIKEYDTIVIARHIGVDPDALCGQLALRDSILLTYPNKKVLAIGTGSNRFLSIGKLDRLEKYNNALLIILDTPDRRRVDSLDFDGGSFTIKIDHHPFIERFCDIELIDDTKSSCCEIVTEMILSSGLECNDSIAELLFMGIVSDSNRFLFSSCNSNTFLTVSKLLSKYNINIEKAYEKLYLRPLGEVRLQGYIATNMIVSKNHLGYVIITDEVINRLGVDSASPANMINDFNYIKDVLVWVTVTEDVKNDQYRISIRSRGPEIHKIAEKYNGGGHKYASGVRVKTLEEAMIVVKELDNKLKEYNSI